MNLKLNKIDWKSQSFRIMLVASLCQFSVSIILNCMHVMLPQISTDLDIPISSLNWITIIFLMTLLASSIPISRNIGHRGVKSSMKLACYGMIIGLILNAGCISIELFFFSRIIQGLAIAILNVCMYMIIILGMPQNKVGYALGFTSSSGYVSMLIAPTLSGFITHHLGWRFVFIFMIIIFIFQLILMRLINEDWKTTKKPIDLSGSIIYIFHLLLGIWVIINYRRRINFLYNNSNTFYSFS